MKQTTWKLFLYEQEKEKGFANLLINSLFSLSLSLFVDEAKQLRWEDAKMMLENLWKYNMLEVDESAGAVITSTQHHH
jgi:hypothetical protein